MDLDEGTEATSWPRDLELDEFGIGKSDVFGRDKLALFVGSGDEGAAGEMVGSAQQASGTLLNGSDGLGGEELGLDPGNCY